MQEKTLSGNDPQSEARSDVSSNLLGKTVGGFLLERELGRGAMGVVFEAIQKDLHRKVAIKILSPQLAADKIFVKRFQTEAESAAKIHHNNIATIFAFGEDHAIYYYAMEYIDGITLDEYIKNNTVNLMEKCSIIAQIASALEYAHQHGIIHRDIKSQNIMIDTENRVVITDFGLAKTEEATILTVDGTIMGTPSYMSPEQAQGSSETPADHRTDIYSLGVIFYEIVTGVLPFTGDSHLAVMKKVVETEPVNPRKIIRNLPREIDTIILTCLEKDPERRYQSCADLNADINRFLNGEPILARPAGLFRKILKKIKKYRVFFATVTFIILISLAGWFSLLYTNWKQSQQHRQILANANRELQTAEEENTVLMTKLSEDPLFRVLEDPDPFVRKNALIALNKKVRGKKVIGKIDEKSFNKTLRALNDENPQVRLSAAGLLCLLEDKRALKPLIDHLDDPDKEVQKYVILALGWLREPNVINHLIQKLNDSDPRIRTSAILALTLIKDNKVVPNIMNLLNDPDLEVRSYAIEALADFKDPTAIQALISLLDDPRESIRIKASEALARYGEASRFPVIMWVLTNKKSSRNDILQAIEALTEKDSLAVPALLALLSSDDVEIRIYATSFLGLFRDPIAIYPLIELLNDPEPRVRESAYFSLIGITLENIGPEQEKWLDWWNKKEESKK